MYLESFGRRVLTLICALVVPGAILGPDRAEALHCPGCDPFRCSSLPDCVGGTTMDPCNCCLECARVVNETCGGQYGVEGRCDEDLICVITPPLGSGISDGQVGVCKEIPSYPEEPSCDDVCETSVPPKCPTDSLIVVGHSHSHKCCPDPPSCRCKPCPTGGLAPCDPGFVRLLKVEGLFRPGNCCDIYECIEHAQFCDHVLCDDVLLFNSTCPDDSVPLPVPQTPSEDSCCPSVQNRCTCKKKSECKVQPCPIGLQKRVRRLATGYPGSCCDQFDCINGSNPVCFHNGMNRSDGETWKLDECTTCVCREGLTFCEPVQCPALSRCSWIGTPDGQCCPVCKGCVSPNGELHLSGATWQQDSCVTCHCEAGQVYCQAQFCAITCSNPRVVPGECCPECDEDSTSVTLASHCPLLSNCTLMCSDGYQKGPDGCYRCQCDEIPEESCDLVCPHGYRADLLGIEVCDCVDPPPWVPFRASTRPTQVQQSSTSRSTLALTVTSTPSTTCPPMTGCTRQCSYGFRKEKSGCPRCRCNKCPLIRECTKKCATGFVYNPEGCRLCKCLDAGLSASATPRSPVDARRCISVDGLRIDEGQVWWDGCRKCFCHHGQEMCALVTCPAVRCSNPVMRPGSCCPSCGGEIAPPISAGLNTCHSTDGRYFVEGETWQLDDCTQCICHQGSALCTIDNCPPTLCHQPVILPHTCCPVCPDQNGFLPSGPWKKDPLRFCRSVGGTRYSSGDTWQVSACQSCTCRDGQIHCFAQTCPILRCNKTFLKKNQCCPICRDNSAKYCTYGDNVYSVDETWLVNECTRCICSAEGQVLCMVTVCETPKCATPIATVGTCCAVCPNVTRTSANDGLSGTNITDVTKEGETERQGLFNRTLIALIVIVIFLFVVVVLLLVLLIHRQKGKTPTVYHTGSKQPPKSNSFSYTCGATRCQKPTNLDYKPNPTSVSSGTASSKLSSSDNSLKIQPCVMSCNEAKPSDSDESLLEKSSFQMGCTESFDDSIKLTPTRTCPTVLDYKVGVHFTAMDRLRMKSNNRRSAGDELEQTRHLLTATPSLGVTNNNRKSW